jgi:hypothetical protein
MPPPASRTRRIRAWAFVELLLGGASERRIFRYENHQIANSICLRITDTVPLSESKSRRWKSHNTQNTSAHSVERPPSRDTQSESGTASRARRPSLEEPTQYRTYCREWSWIFAFRNTTLGWRLTYIQNTCRCRYAINAPKIEGNC